MVGLVILGALALMALGAPWLSPRDPIKTAPRAALQPPGATYWLGSDQLGRDVASRVVHGARISLTVGLIAVTIAVVIGAPIGLVAGFYGGRLDAIVMRVIDVLLAFPGILLALGIRDPSILVRYILPNVVAPLVVTATLGLGTAILAAAGLSFLGLGSQPPQPEWGRMLSEGRDYLREAWWISTFPGLGIMLTVLGMNLLGDGLRDVLDPRLKV